MFYTLESDIVHIKSNQENEIKNKINVFYQFFIDQNKDRYKEFLFCLKKI
jgi:hypothetical protein